MFKKSTFFMRVIIILLGAAVLIPVILFTPRFLMYAIEVMQHMVLSTSTWSWYYGVVLLFGVAVFGAMVPFLMALYQTMKLLGFIDKKETFSEKSVKALNVIKNCAVAIFAIYLIGVMPMVRFFVESDDAPGGSIIWAAFSLIPLAIAIFASMLMNLIKEAIEIKSENDLTI